MSRGLFLRIALLAFTCVTNAFAQISAISTRSLVQQGDNVMIAGFIIGGSSPKTVVVRARGPSLGVAGVLLNPRMTIVPAAGGPNLVNDDWLTAPNAAQLAATGFAPGHSLESALLVTLNPGAYTAIVSGVGALTGVAIVEVYEVAVNMNQTNSAKLLGGTWAFIYTISTSTFQQNYTFTSIDSTAASGGEYFVRGTNQFGSPIIGAYFPSGSNWSVLEPGSIIDRFYVFNFSDNNHVSGCYHQVNPPGSTNLSQCFAMTGIRSPFLAALKSWVKAANAIDELTEASALAGSGFIQEGTVDAYMTIRKHLGP